MISSNIPNIGFQYAAVKPILPPESISQYRFNPEAPIYAWGLPWPVREMPPEKFQHASAKKAVGLFVANQHLCDQIEKFDPVRASRMRHCGERMGHYQSVCEHNAQSKIFNAQRCRDKLCYSCSKSMAHRLAETLGVALKKFAAQFGLYLYFLTLTLRDSSFLPERKWLIRVRREFFQDDVFQSIGWYGGYHNLEVKIGAGSKLWHPHIHVLVFTKSPLPTYVDASGVEKVDLGIAKRITDVWARVTKGKGLVTDFRPYNDGPKELFKYMTKGFKDISPEKQAEFGAWSKRLRCKGRVGALYRNKTLTAMIESEETGYAKRVDKAPHCPDCNAPMTIKVEYHRTHDMKLCVDFVGNLDSKSEAN